MTISFYCSEKHARCLIINKGLIKNIYSLVLVLVGREGQEAMNPVENLRTLWSGLRTPWKVSEPHEGGFLKKT